MNTKPNQTADNMVNVLICTYRNSVGPLADKEQRVVRMSRVPVRGECIYYDSLTVFVDQVYHYPNPGPESAAAAVYIKLRLD